MLNFKVILPICEFFRCEKNSIV